MIGVYAYDADADAVLLSGDLIRTTADRQRAGIGALAGTVLAEEERCRAAVDAPAAAAVDRP